MNEKDFNQINIEKLTDLIGEDNTVATNCINTTVATTVAIADIIINQCCPHCGESYYMENYSISTCVYYPPIYKDGVNINPDRNTTTVYCTCMNCKKDFSFTR